MKFGLDTARGGPVHKKVTQNWKLISVHIDIILYRIAHPAKTTDYEYILKVVLTLAPGVKVGTGSKFHILGN